MKAILTTIGKDKPGIVAGVSAFLAEQDINVLDISQTIMDGNFTMMMMVQLDDDQDFNQLIDQLNQLGKKLDVDINVRNEALYNAMHQL